MLLLTVLWGVEGCPSLDISPRTGHSLQSVNDSTRSHKALLFMGFSIGGAGNPSTMLETQTAGYLSEHRVTLECKFLYLY